MTPQDKKELKFILSAAADFIIAMAIVLVILFIFLPLI